MWGHGVWEMGSRVLIDGPLEVADSLPMHAISLCNWLDRYSIKCDGWPARTNSEQF